MKLFYDMKSNLYNVLILKYVPVANVSIAHYMEGVIRQQQKTKQAENEKKKFFERLHWAAFQLFIEKYYTWQNNTF